MLRVHSGTAGRPPAVSRKSRAGGTWDVRGLHRHDDPAGESLVRYEHAVVAVAALGPRLAGPPCAEASMGGEEAAPARRACHSAPPPPNHGPLRTPAEYE
ncbi:hypothetical protein GCM10010512_21670 [Streptomyces thermoviolaceus subsp. thermoviolaceus]|nr:hypothetical protein GCM10010499_06900 [Streptomyces thermoviolaceus subsp. apingens]GHA89981.1 hypothetical protein GCM10010512_21670 [Streptomyces thermoviolaceus subsp. thermoviolaceus]